MQSFQNASVWRNHTLDPVATPRAALAFRAIGRHQTTWKSPASGAPPATTTDPSCSAVTSADVAPIAIDGDASNTRRMSMSFAVADVRLRDHARRCIRGLYSRPEFIRKFAQERLNGDFRVGLTHFPYGDDPDRSAERDAAVEFGGNGYDQSTMEKRVNLTPKSTTLRR
jgi:hypothetical protein